MQYVPGRSLADAPIPLAAAPLHQLADGLAEALAALHRGGLTHRDVKPGNVILTFDGPVLVDLGIAASADATSFTAHGTAVGTPAWMAPEQLAGAVSGPPADVWGWAAVVSYAATGRSPFGDGPVPALAYRIQHGEPNLAGLPAWLRDAVTAGLSKNPAQRPTASELVDGAAGRTMSMRPAAATVPVASGEHQRAGVASTTRGATRLDTSRRRRWVPAVVGAGVVLIAGVAVAVVIAVHNHDKATASPPRPTATTPSPNTAHSRAATTSSAPATTTPTPPMSTAAATSHPSSPPSVEVNAQLLRALGVCSTQCVITGEVAIEHPVWGRSTLITTAPSATETTRGTAHIALIDTAGRLRWSYTMPGMYSLAPAPKPIDATGHVFLNYNPGRYNGVIVLGAIGGGFDDFGSLPKQDDPVGGRFYSATATDVNGTYEIDVAINNCVPTCANGKLEHTIYQWTGTAYAAI
jgi:hypothetical protein